MASKMYTCWFCIVAFYRKKHTDLCTLAFPYIVLGLFVAFIVCCLFSVDSVVEHNYITSSVGDGVAGLG